MTNKYFHRALGAGALFILMLTSLTGSASAQNRQIFYCKDNTAVEIPASAPGGITADQACVNNGGAASGQTYKCNDGTTVFIPSNAPGGITASQACSNSGGAAGNEPTTPGLGGIEEEADRAFGECAGGSETGCGLIEKYLNPAINLLSALAGMVVIIMIIVGGIQYASSGGDASKVAAAKGRIANALIAVVAFLFLYAVLQWLVPGGLF